MKRLINKMFAAAICSIASLLFVLPAKAQFTFQLEEKDLPVSEFSTISAEDGFEITLAKGAYAVHLTTDQALAPYVQVYVRSKTLYLNYDNKAVPKDIRKLYQGKNAPAPVFRATVYLPEVNGISLKDNASVVGMDDFFGNAVVIDLQDKAIVKKLSLNAKSVTVRLKKNAQAALQLRELESLESEQEGNTALQLDVQSQKIACSQNGSSVLECSAVTPKAAFKAAGTSKLTGTLRECEEASVDMNNTANLALSGTARKLVLAGDKNATLEAGNLAVDNVETTMDGGKATVGEVQSIQANLTGGAALYFSGKPSFEVVKIIKSTLAPVGSEK